jgi:hypothetical protein
MIARQSIPGHMEDVYSKDDMMIMGRPSIFMKRDYYNFGKAP